MQLRWKSPLKAQALCVPTTRLRNNLVTVKLLRVLTMDRIWFQTHGAENMAFVLSLLRTLHSLHVEHSLQNVQRLPSSASLSRDEADTVSNLELWTVDRSV
jgi:hypothetical protein